MTNTQVVDLLVAGISEGLPHPDGKPRVLMNYRTSTLPPELADKVRTETRGLAEAIEHHLVVNGLLVVPAAELEQLRANAQPATERTIDTPEVWCNRIGCQCKEPLMALAITNPKRLTTDGPTLIAALAGRTTECPHGPR